MRSCSIASRTLQRRLDPEIEGQSATFSIPPDARNVWLVSDTGVPAEVGCGADLRTLGVFLDAITVAAEAGTTRVFPAAHRSLGCGFHEVEETGPPAGLASRPPCGPA